MRTTLLCTVLFLALVPPAEARVNYALIREIKADLRGLLMTGEEEDWHGVLAENFSTGLGEDAEAKSDFARNITQSETYRKEFKRILSARCANDEKYMFCPARWLRCYEDEKCNTGARLLVDIAGPEWKIHFYGEGE